MIVTMSEISMKSCSKIWLFVGDLSPTCENEVLEVHFDNSYIICR